MNAFLNHFPLFLSGLAAGAIFFLWRRSASRWNNWFPLLKKLLSWAFIGAAIANAVYAVLEFQSPGVSSGGGLLALVVGVLIPEIMSRRGSSSASKDETKRGASMGKELEVTKRVRAAKVPTYLELANVPIPIDAEPYHFLIAGSTGTGKSVAINTFLNQIRARGDTAIVVDSGGNFVAQHFDPKNDFVFNPYDDRCVGWSPTAEMQGAWDASALARSIVPDGVGDGKEWNAYAQTFVGAILRRLWEFNRLTMRDFLYYVQAAPREELQTLLEGTAAASQLGSERTFGSIRTIAGNYVAAYDYLPTDRETFSVAEMIRAEHSGMLFLTYRDDQLDSVRNLLACMLDVAARTILSLDAKPGRRVWLVIDEFASLGKVQSIEAMATKARKAGGCLVLGIQSVSQLKDRYGDNGAQTILSCLSTWLVLRCSDADTAEYMSKYIGEAEVRRTQKGLSNSDTGDTQSWNEQSAVQRVVLGSQIQAYPNLTGLLKLAGDYPVCEVVLGIPKADPLRGAKPFLARDFLLRPMLKLEASAVAKPLNPPPALAPGEKVNALAAYADRSPWPVKSDNSLGEVSRQIKPLLESALELSLEEEEGEELSEEQLQDFADKLTEVMSGKRAGRHARVQAFVAEAPVTRALPVADRKEVAQKLVTVMEGTRTAPDGRPAPRGKVPMSPADLQAASAQAEVEEAARQANESKKSAAKKRNRRESRSRESLEGLLR